MEIELEEDTEVGDELKKLDVTNDDDCNEEAEAALEVNEDPDGAVEGINAVDDDDGNGEVKEGVDVTGGGGVKPPYVQVPSVPRGMLGP